MSHFKAKMHQILFRLGASPHTPLGEVTAEVGEGKGRPNLLLNRGPSEPCYATASASDCGACVSANDGHFEHIMRHFI